MLTCIHLSDLTGILHSHLQPQTSLVAYILTYSLEPPELSLQAYLKPPSPPCGLIILPHHPRALLHHAAHFTDYSQL